MYPMTEKIVYAIVGLPASGKTELSRKWLNSGKVEFVCDDPKELWEFTDALKRYDTIAISDPAFCYTVNRNRMELIAKENGFTVKYTFFQNDFSACLNNARYRPDKIADSFINNLTQVYEIPEGYKGRQVFNCGSSDESLLKNMIAICAGELMIASDSDGMYGGGYSYDKIEKALTEHGLLDEIRRRMCR
jgi:hypothetical protein